MCGASSYGSRYKTNLHELNIDTSSSYDESEARRHIKSASMSFGGQNVQAGLALIYVHIGIDLVALLHSDL